MELLNQTLMNELQAALGADLRGLLSMYAESLPEQVEAVQAAWRSGDREELKRLAHDIKGSSSSVGAEALSTVCGAIERQVDGGVDLAELTSSLEQLPTLAQSSLQAMRESGWL